MLVISELIEKEKNRSYTATFTFDIVTTYMISYVVVYSLHCYRTLFSTFLTR